MALSHSLPKLSVDLESHYTQKKKMKEVTLICLRDGGTSRDVRVYGQLNRNQTKATQTVFIEENIKSADCVFLASLSCLFL